jgi:EAL domain-containing protein (putative c-di-GMP-specific phosphodiesterase class I)
MNVTAEGIETPAQLAHLASLNCESAQGYFLSRPIHADEATDLLRTGMHSAPPQSSTDAA